MPAQRTHVPSKKRTTLKTVVPTPLKKWNPAVNPPLFLRGGDRFFQWYRARFNWDVSLHMKCALCYENETKNDTSVIFRVLCYEMQCRERTNIESQLYDNGYEALFLYFI